MTDKATPRPWRIYEVDDGMWIESDPPIPHENVIADMVGRQHAGQITDADRANAELIVRAVNRDPHFDEVVAALEVAKATIRAFNGLGMNDEVEQACWDAYQSSPEMKLINAALTAGKTDGKN